MTASDSAPHEQILRYRQLHIRVRASDAADLEWLSEFLSPHFKEAAGRPDRQVTLKRDEALFGRVEAAGPLEGHEPAACFAFDNSLLRLPVWRPLDDRRVIFDDSHAVFYLVAPDDSEVTILARAEPPGGRIPFMRIAREWAMSHGMHSGGLFLHASSFAVDGRAVVLAGEKSAGKTSLLIHALRHPASTYLSNDRVLASGIEGDTTFTGMPTIATIRSTTLPLFPALRERLPTVRNAHHRRVRSVFEPGEPMRPWGDGRYGLTPAQFTSVLRTASTAEAQAAAIVFPKVTGSPGRLTLHEIDPATALDNLRDAVFGIGAWSELGDVFVAPNAAQSAAPPDPTDRCRRLVETLPTFECELGLQAYDDSRSADALIEAALGHAVR